MGLGFAMIFRLSGGLAAEQATWIAVGLVAFAATLMIVRDHRMLDAYTYTIGLPAHVSFPEIVVFGMKPVIVCDASPTGRMPTCP